MTELPRVVIAGAHSGAGKTSVTLALLSALTEAGQRPQPFKVGPDYIDPGYHTAVAGRPSRNLDVWMMGRQAVRTAFLKGMRGAGVGVVEGVMGLFDGLGTSETSSTAQMAKLLRAPVLLVIDGRGLSRSAAALALGYRRFDPKLRVAGIILTKVSGERHARLISSAIESKAGLPVLGFLPADPAVRIPERPLGLTTAGELGALKELWARLGVLARRHFRLDEILRLARRAPALPWPRPAAGPGAESRRGRLAVARDAAFSFYYQDNLDLLEEAGAELAFFSPLRDRALPKGCGGLYFGGGFPELHAAELQDNAPLRRAVRERILEGMPVYAECGGLMYLSRELVDKQGRSWSMVAAVPGKTVMTDRLQDFGYGEARALRKSVLAEAGETVRGHEFHYSLRPAPPSGAGAAYEIEKAGTGRRRREGYARGNVLASYQHVHFLSRPSWARRLVAAASRFEGAGAAALALALALLLVPSGAQAMHISEGILPAPWAALWFLVAAPFVAWGLRDLDRRSAVEPLFKPLVGLVGAAVFVISCMPIPVPTAGTCSHPCGTGLAAIILGPALTVVITAAALLLQALFLAHGGLTTLGANIVSMGVVGAFSGYGVFRLSRRLGLSWAVSAFLAGLISDWATYAATSVELASALHGQTSFTRMFVVVLLAFVPTQVPLGVLEGFLTAGACRFIRARRPELLVLETAEAS